MFPIQKCGFCTGAALFSSFLKLLSFLSALLFDKEREMGFQHENKDKFRSNQTGCSHFGRHCRFILYGCRHSPLFRVRSPYAGLLGQYVVLTTLNRQDIDEELEKSKDQLLYPQYDSKKDLWGYVDENGKRVIDPEYKEAGRFTDDGVARVIKATGRTAYILKIGKESTVYNISGDYKDGDDFHNGVARVTDDDGTEKYINIYGTELKNYQG